MYRSIVVGTDGSPTAERAVKQAAELASAVGAQVHVVSAYRPVAEARAQQSTPASDLGAGDVGPDSQVNAILDHAAAVFRSAGVQVERHAVRGEAAGALIDVADQRGADLIIVGNRGMSGTKRFLLGSVPDKVSHHAPCSVMILHTTG